MGSENKSLLPSFSVPVGAACFSPASGSFSLLLRKLLLPSGVEPRVRLSCLQVKRSEEGRGQRAEGRLPVLPPRLECKAELPAPLVVHGAVGVEGGGKREGRMFAVIIFIDLSTRIPRAA